MPMKKLTGSGTAWTQAIVF